MIYENDILQTFVHFPDNSTLSIALSQVDGQKFQGQGRSKKLAKMAAAKAALKTFLESKGEVMEVADYTGTQTMHPSVNLMDMCPSLAHVDFTSDDPIETNFIINEINRLRNSTLVNGKLVVFPRGSANDSKSGDETTNVAEAEKQPVVSEENNSSNEPNAVDTGNEQIATGGCDADFERLFEKIRLSIDHYNIAKLKLQSKYSLGFRLISIFLR